MAVSRNPLDIASPLPAPPPLSPSHVQVCIATVEVGGVVYMLKHRSLHACMRPEFGRAILSNWLEGGEEPNLERYG